MCELRFKATHDEAILPTKAYPTDSGWDVYSIEDVWLEPNSCVKAIDTGLVLAYLTEGYELQVRARSGNTLKKAIIVANAPGTIDNSYRGSIKVLMAAIGYETILINKGDKIAQLIPVKIDPSFVSWGEIVPSDRGVSGFGSSDKVKAYDKGL